MKLELFKKKFSKKKKSLLEEFKSDIFELHEDGYSLQTIQKYLETRGVKTCISNISRFIGRSKNIKSKNIKRETKVKEKIEDEVWGVKIKANNPILEALEK